MCCIRLVIMFFSMLDGLLGEFGQVQYHTENKQTLSKVISNEKQQVIIMYIYTTQVIIMYMYMYTTLVIIMYIYTTQVIIMYIYITQVFMYMYTTQVIIMYMYIITQIFI